jgi:hypothetical protein
MTSKVRMAKHVLEENYVKILKKKFRLNINEKEQALTLKNSFLNSISTSWFEILIQKRIFSGLQHTFFFNL